MSRTRSQSLAARLVLSYLVVILTGLGSGALLAWLAVEQLYVETQEANLLAQASYVAAALSTGPSPVFQPEPYSQAVNVMPGIHTRLLDSEGAVLIGLTEPDLAAGSASLALPELAQETDSAVTLAELLSRPEIVKALQGVASTAVRQVTAGGGRRVLYAAAPVMGQVEGADPVVSQIVYLASPLPDTQWSALPASLRWRFAVALLAAGTLAAGAGLVLARRMARPLQALAQAARAVAGGDLNTSAPVETGFTELAVVGQAFNHMTHSLRQADQAKTAFVSDVSHELRTPLTVIKGSIETLQDGAINDPPARDTFLASLSRETERLIRLVNDLLVLTRADADALNLHLQPLDSIEFAQARCALFQPAVGLRGVSLSVVDPPGHGTPGGCTVQADPDRLAQVLDNLLDNALRYSPEGGSVRIVIQKESERVVFNVLDSGPGIPPEHLPLIFERFYRADPARDRTQGGSGLGLAIVRSLVQAMGGGVEASSLPGEGTTVKFWLPLAKN